MKYYLFFSDETGALYQIGYVDGVGREEQEIIDELWHQMHDWLQANLPNRKVYYYNIWNEDGFTVVDFGSHFEFFKIKPEVEISKIGGAE